MNRKTDTSMRSSNVVACIWDFDKTLIPAYMQTPIFKEYDVDEKTFWREVNMLPQIYAERGIRVSPETVYLNHLLTFVKAGYMQGLSNAKLKRLGGKLQFCPGIPPSMLTEFSAANFSKSRCRRISLNSPNSNSTRHRRKSTKSA